MKLYSIHDPEFRPYGHEIQGYDCSELIRAMADTPLPEDVLYVPSAPELEALSVFQEISEREFGGLPAQLGYCNGHNKALNALEYHRSSEINVACTDLVLLLGRQQDVDPVSLTYDTSKVEAFFVPAGSMIEVYGTTLHYAPCHTEESGFRCVVLLHRDTNLDLERKPAPVGEDKLLFARNKWLIAHPESGLEEQGAFAGLVGENITME